MIRHLDGMKETVDFHGFPSILLYDNNDYEDYPPHWHTSIEIIMPTDNTYTVNCNNQPYDVRVGEILIIAPGAVHSMAKQHGKRYIFQIDYSRFSLLQDFNSILSLIQPAVILNKEEFPDVYDECRRLYLENVDEYNGVEVFKEYAIYTNFLQFLKLIGRNIAKQRNMFQDKSAEKQEEYIKKFLFLCEYINTHCAENLTVDAAANMVGFSKFYFTRLFKKFTGNTFYNYVNVCRINQASLLLLDPQKNITEVAINSGFNSISSFIRIFKIIKGCTPTEFRNLPSSGEASSDDSEDEKHN